MLSQAHIEIIKEQYSDPDKRIAFTAIGSTGTLGIAVENESGYYPIPDYWHHEVYYPDLCSYADKLNTENLELTEKEAANIVISTLRGALSNASSYSD